MPQLKSGRHVALSASPLLDKIKCGSDVSVSAAIMAFRLSVSSPQQLRDFLTVGYFQESEGNPPNAPSYSSGFLVKDVLEGKAGWSEEEIREFENWLNTSPEVNQWVSEQFKEINTVIRNHVVWGTPFWTDDESEKADQ